MRVANLFLCGCLAECHEQLVAIEPHDMREGGVVCRVEQDIDLPNLRRLLDRDGSIDFRGVRRGLLIE